MRSDPKILVTGCAGYVGSVLVGRLLDWGYTVVGVDKLMFNNGPALLPYLGHPCFEFHELDVQDTLPVSGLAAECDVVIPLAALVGAPLCDKDGRHNEMAHAVNYWAVKNLVKGLSHHQLVIYPNTNSGYGTTEGTRACTEDDQLAPISTYGWTKGEGEKAVLDHPKGVSFRLATVFGASPRMRLDLMVNDFTVKLKRDKSISIFEPHFMRNFVGVQDVACAFIHAIQRPKRVAPGAYNLGLPDANLTKMQLAHEVCDVLGLPLSAATVGAGEDPDKRNYLVSNDKILATGFRFGHRLVDGIREVATVYDTHTPAQLAQMRNV